MKKLNAISLGLVAGAFLAGCSDDTISFDSEMREQYVRDFIERYGVPDPDHTFNMASRKGVTVKSSTPVDVKVYAMVGREQYAFADWKAVSGTQLITFDVPSSVEQLALVVDGRVYHAKVGDVVNVDAPARAASRATTEPTDVDFSEKDIVTYTTSPVTGGVLKPYSQFNVYYGALSPICEDKSNKFYNNPNHKYKDANGGTTHWWCDHNNRVPATLMRQFVGTTKKFYEDPKFKDTGFDRVYSVASTVPSLYIHHVKKSLNYEMGIMIGDAYTLSASNHIYCIPMVTSYGLDGTVHNSKGRNQILRMVQTAEEEADFDNCWGVTMSFYFDRQENNVKYFNDDITWNFDDAKAFGNLKASIINMAGLYASGKLPLPIEMANADNIDPAYPDKDNVVKYVENETGKAFFESYNKYLIWSIDNKLSAEDKANYYSDLFGLKEYLGVRNYMISSTDVPVVTNIKDGDGKDIPDQYLVRYPLAKKADGFAALAEETEVLEPEVEGKKLYSNMKDNYVVYRVMDFGVAFPPSQLNHNYVYYVKNLDKKPEDEGYLTTTLDGKIKMLAPTMYGQGEDATAYYDARLCWDVDGDDIYNDIVFTHSSTGWFASASDKYTWILACEDLGGTGDHDFNDVVVAVKYESTNQQNQEPVSFYPLAAGGKYPAYLMYNEKYMQNGKEVTRTYVVGKEIHQWLGAEAKDGDYGYINTGEDFPHENLTDGGHRVEYTYQSTFADNSFPGLMGEIKDKQNQNSDDNRSFCGLWVLVDRNNDLANYENNGFKFEFVEDMNEILPEHMADFKEATKNCETVVNKAAYDGTAVPMIMMLGSEWEWPAETKDIDLAYPDWRAWLGERATHWYGPDPVTGKYSDDVKRELVTKRKDVSNTIEGDRILVENSEE